MRKIYIVLLFSLYFLNSNAQDGVHLDWAIANSSPYGDEGVFVTTDGFGNVYTVGTYFNTIDFDPGPDTYNLSSNGATDVYIQKLDQDGNFIWARSFGGPLWEYAYSVQIDVNGNANISGTYSYVVDFDPGSDIELRHYIEDGPTYLLQLNADGDFNWVDTWSFTFEPYSPVATDDYGNFYLTGYFRDTTDFDPGHLVYELVSINSLNGYTKDAFILKLNNNGQFDWVENFVGSSDEMGHSISINNEGHIILAGKFGGAIDADPSSGVNNLFSGGIFLIEFDALGDFEWALSAASNYFSGGVYIDSDLNNNIYLNSLFHEDMAVNTVDDSTYQFTSIGFTDAFILKVNSVGEYQWLKYFGDEVPISIEGIGVDSSGFVYSIGNFNDTVDFDPGPGLNEKISNGEGDAFIQKLNTYGDFMWVKCLGGSEMDKGNSIHIDEQENIYSTGVFRNTVDFDPGTDSTSLTSAEDDAFVQKLSQDSCANLTLVLDSIRDIGCIVDGYAALHAIGGEIPYAYSWNANPPNFDSVSVFVTGGIYSMEVMDDNNCVSSSTIFINGPLSGFASFDVNANLVNNNFRSGFTSNLWIDALNETCIGTSGQISLVLDELVSFDSSSIVPNQIIGNTLIWEYDSLYYDSDHFMSELIVTTSEEAMVGDTLCFDLSITPFMGDLDTTNNNKTYCFQVINSYDPNDKKVYPQGICEEHYVLKTEDLTYTIRFQNTGNAEAFNIHIIDSISEYLNINTVNVLGSSHPVYMEVRPGNVLDFKFDNIYLPDSGSNEELSHGYVIFEISPNSNLSNGTYVSNKSEIYFDFNLPIVTNSVFNTLVNELLSCDISMGVEEDVKNENNILIYPNPVNSRLYVVLENQLIKEVEILDLGGKVLLKGYSNSIDVSALPRGIYFISISTKEMTVSRKFIKN